MIVGSRVEQRIQLSEDGADLIKVAMSGVVVACDRSGTPAEYVALVMRDDGSLVQVRAELLTVTELKDKSKVKPVTLPK
jgi:hypothetical protein